MQLFIYLVLICLGAVSCNQLDLPPELDDLQNKLGPIPGLENIEKDAPSVEEVIDAAKSKCIKNGGESAFDDLMLAKDEVQRCIELNFNFTQIEAELAEKRKTGSMDDTFVKYCGKRAIVDACVKNFTEKVAPCLEDVEKSSLELLLNITDNLIDFGCYKDGDRIGMFLAEGGLECIRNKSEGLEGCFNRTVHHRIPQTLSLASLPLFVLNEGVCEDFNNLHKCVITVLETCDDHTPANLIDATFKYTRRSTPCRNNTSTSRTPTAMHRRVFRRDIPSQELTVLQKAYDKLKQKFEPHCLQNGGQKASDEFREGLRYVERCESEVQANFLKKNEEVRGLSYDYMCNEVRTGLRRCISNMTKKMEACVSKAEKYVPKFGLEIYDSVFKYQCKDDARALKMLLGEQDTCTKTILGSTEHCIGKTKYIHDYSKEGVITKTELCGDLKLLRNCFRDMASQHCPNNNNFNDIVKGFSDSIYAPCASCTTLSSILLTFALLIFSKLL